MLEETSQKPSFAFFFLYTGVLPNESHATPGALNFEMGSIRLFENECHAVCGSLFGITVPSMISMRSVLSATVTVCIEIPWPAPRQGTKAKCFWRGWWQQWRPSLLSAMRHCDTGLSTRFDIVIQDFVSYASYASIIIRNWTMLISATMTIYPENQCDQWYHFTKWCIGSGPWSVSLP